MSRREPPEPGHAVIVTPELWGVTRENGGISTSVFHTARLLRGRGDRVTVLVGVAKEVELDSSWASRYDREGIDVFTAPASRFRPDQIGAHGLNFPFRRISEAVADAIPADADVVYFQDWSALGFEYLRGQMGADAGGGPVAVTVLRSSSKWIRESVERTTDGDANERGLDFAERLAIEQSDLVVSPSRAYREYLEAEGCRLPGGERTRILGHPWLPYADGQTVQTASRPGNPFRRLIFFGRLDTAKGFDLLLEALRLLHLERPDILTGIGQLVLLGREGRHRQPDLASVDREFRTLGIETVLIPDLDSWGARRVLEENAHEALVVIPSLRENFCNAAVEATLVPGLNVICSNAGGIPELFGGRGADQLFSPDFRALSDTLARWIERGVRPASELVSYDWEAANAGWLRFHEEVLDRARLAPRATGPRPAPRGSPPSAPTTRLSIVLSTYEWPAALDAVLRSLLEQSDAGFEVVVADDGSGPETAAVVDRWQVPYAGRLAHVWQPDAGARLAHVRNLGAAAARGDYLVFMDGDCIPRRHFVAAVRRAALRGWFLAGKRVQLSPELSRAVIEDRLPVSRWSVPRLVLRTGRGIDRPVHLTLRDRRRPWRDKLPEFFPDGNAYGFLQGVARDDFELVNGYDLQFLGWGDQDVDLAVRLRRLGLRCGYAGPQTTVLHLWHASRSTPDRATWRLLQESIQSERIRAAEGLRELAAEYEAQLSAKRAGASSSSSAPVKL